jgi:hypothetical protein
MIRVASYWKATIYIYNLKKFQKIQIFFAFTAVCLKSLNSIYGTHRPLGVKKTKDFSNLIHTIHPHDPSTPSIHAIRAPPFIQRFLIARRLSYLSDLSSAQAHLKLLQFHTLT